MTFDDLDGAMRAYEQSFDMYVAPKMYIVVRLDGRSFTKFTKNVCKFEAPFDERFRDLMVETLRYLMENSGFQTVYGFTESDEMSILFKLDDNTFGRKIRKINTTLAGEASAFFTSLLQKAINDKIIEYNGDRLPIATFDCRVCPLPNIDVVKDYFVWRQEDACRNSLNGWCYWTLRKNGESARMATSILEGKGNSYKNELLFQNGINFNDLPTWQKRGVGIEFKEVEKEGFNPYLGTKVISKRRVTVDDYELPYGDEYRNYIERLIK